MGFLELIIFLVLLALGYFVGRWQESRHYASIREREAKYANILAFAVRYPPDVVTRERAAFYSFTTTRTRADGD